MQVTEEQVKEYLRFKGFYTHTQYKNYADLISAKEIAEAQTALLLAKLEEDRVNTLAAQYEKLPTIQECAEFIGVKFNTLNMSGAANKLALRHGIRELRRLTLIHKG